MDAEEKLEEQKAQWRLVNAHVGHKLDCSSDGVTATIGCRECGVDLLVVRWPGVKLEIVQWEWRCPGCERVNHENVSGDTVECQYCDRMFEAQP